MISHSAIINLSALVTIAGFSVQSHQARETGGCTGVLSFQVSSCPAEESDMKDACKAHFQPLLGCGKPGEALCGPNGTSEEVYIFCNYNA